MIVVVDAVLLERVHGPVIGGVADVISALKGRLLVPEYSFPGMVQCTNIV